LHLFYQKVANLGGYESCVSKKAWKTIYDELGGNPQNTSAATCTRRHYEKFLLTFERHQRGLDAKRARKGSAASGDAFQAPATPVSSGDSQPGTPESGGDKGSPASKGDQESRRKDAEDEVQEVAGVGEKSKGQAEDRKPIADDDNPLMMVPVSKSTRASDALLRVLPL